MRSTWKIPFVDKTLYNNVKQDKPVKTWSRRSLIIPYFINKTIQVHNGKEFKSITIKENMVGHKLGEFVNTRKRHLYTKKKKK